jgi:hypothetical protein
MSSTSSLESSVLLETDFEEEFRVQTVFHKIQQQFGINPITHVIQSDQLDSYFLKNLAHDIEVLISEKINRIKKKEEKEDAINVISKVAIHYSFQNFKNPKYVVFQNNDLHYLIGKFGYQKYNIFKNNDNLSSCQEEINISEIEHSLEKERKNINRIKLAKLREGEKYGYLNLSDFRKHFEGLNLNNTYLRNATNTLSLDETIVNSSLDNNKDETVVNEVKENTHEIMYVTDIIFDWFFQYMKNDGVIIHNLHPDRNYLKVIFYVFYSLRLPINKLKFKITVSEENKLWYISSYAKEPQPKIGDAVFRTMKDILGDRFKYYPKLEEQMNVLQSLVDPENRKDSYRFLYGLYNKDEDWRLNARPFDQSLLNLKGEITRELSEDDQIKANLAIEIILNIGKEEKRLETIREENFNQFKSYNDKDLLLLYTSTINKLHKEQIKEKEEKDRLEEIKFNIKYEEEMERYKKDIEEGLKEGQTMNFYVLPQPYCRANKPLWFYISCQHEELNGLYLSPDIDYQEYEKDIIKTIQMINRCEKSYQYYDCVDKHQKSYAVFDIKDGEVTKYSKREYDFLHEKTLWLREHAKNYSQEDEDPSIKTTNVYNIFDVEDDFEIAYAEIACNFTDIL